MSANLSDRENQDSSPQSRIERQMQAMGKRARKASRTMAAAEPGAKNAALFAIAEALVANRSAILSASVK